MFRPTVVRNGILSAALGLCACASTAPRQPPGEPPTPDSVSVEQPGGDAHDPHRAALKRQIEQPWGARNDKDDQIHAPTPDWRNWKRVRYRLFEHFTGFRYGNDHHVIAVVFLLDVPEGERQTSATCMQRFEAWARPQVNAYEVTFQEFRSHKSKWREQPLLIHYVDGHVDIGFDRHEFSAAWAAYAAYPDACLVYAVTVPWDGDDELAKSVRQRWVDEGFERMRPLTERRPQRK